MSFDEYDKLAQSLNHLKDVLFQLFAVSVFVGLIAFSWNLFYQFRTFSDLNQAMLQEQASRKNLHQAMWAKSRLRNRQLEEVAGMMHAVSTGSTTENQ